MINRKDISDFFDLEAEAAKKSWEATMSLPIKERIRKRKAIQSVFLDRDYHTTTEEYKDLLKLTFSVNLSDFKEGEPLILHKEESVEGIKCTLFSFEGEDTIYIEVYPGNMWELDSTYYDRPLVLDKDLVDLREFVFSPFIYSLPESSDVFWDKLLFNKTTAPDFEDIENIDEILEDLQREFNLQLLPCQREAVKKSFSAKDYYLIQGPPGTGKSFVLGLIIIAEYVCQHKVIVIGPNHMAINNALGQIMKTYPPFSSAVLKVGQAYYAPKHKAFYKDNEYLIRNIHYLNTDWANNYEGPWIIGLTPHSLYSSRARYLECDTLVIDEAGQMTIPLALMGMIKAKKVIFAGDHKQLPPIVSSDEIREEMRKSAFEALINDDNHTMLDVSFRMCEPICNFVSELFYEGKVKAMKKGCGDMIICNDPLYSFKNPVVIHHVEDYGEQTSDKEADFIVETIAGFLKKGLPADEVAVLSPFRAQAANIRRKIHHHADITEEQAKLITADTVDKMQGQEREVIFFTLVAGNWDYMIDMADFLYNPNKLNVAFSRAKSKLIIVGNIDQISKIDKVTFPHLELMINSSYVTRV